MIIIVLLPIQLYFGWYHHHRYVLDKPTSRRWFTHVHLWLGRGIIVLGMINCGLGLHEAFVDKVWVAAWFIVCALLAIFYAIMSIIVTRFRALAVKNAEPFVQVSGKKVFSPERYSKMEAYEMTNGSTGNTPQRPGRI